MNEELQKDLEQEIEEIDEKALMKEKITSFNDKLKNQQKILIDRLGKKADLYKYKDFDYKPINILRKYVYAVIGANRLLNIVNNNRGTILNQSIKLFINYYESMNNNLATWVFTCVRTPYISIINTEGLNIDIASYGNISDLNQNKIEDVYIRLETRLTGFIKSLYEDDALNKIDQSIISYLSLIVTKDAYIPKEFFTLFEYSRIKTFNQELQFLNEKQSQMILAVYILVKILCKNILLDNQFNKSASLSNATKNNYKICASIIYRSVIDYFKGVCPVVRRINNMVSFKDDKEISRAHASSMEKKKLLYEINESKPQGEVDLSYLEACKKYDANKKNLNLNISKEDGKALEKVVEKIQKYEPDTDELEIEAINKICYKSADLKTFQRFAEKNKYVLSKYIAIFLEKLISKLEVKSIQS